MTKVLTVLAARRVVMTAAFAALLAIGRLSEWAPWTFLRVVRALDGVFALEFSLFFVHSVFADGRVLPRYRIIFAVLATAFRLCGMAGWFLWWRWLFLIGVGASMIVGCTGRRARRRLWRSNARFCRLRTEREHRLRAAVGQPDV